MKELFKLQNDKEKTRIEIFDFFRGSAVMLVLLHHVGIPYGRYILAFHMPLFFILSGYLYKKRNTIESRGFADFIKQKARRILVPYFGFELIIMCLSMICVRNNFNLLQNVKSILLCINLNTSAGIVLRLWFLPCIFVSEIYFYIVNKGLKNSKVRYLVPLFFFAASKVFNIITDARLPFTLDVSLMGTGFICCGYYFYDVVERIGRKMNKIQNVICNAVLMIVYILSTYFNGNLLMYIDEYGSYFLAITSSLSGSLLFIIILKRLYNICKKGIIYKYILFLGKQSLIFFPMHLVIMYFVEKILKIVGINQWSIKALAVGLICIPVINFIVMYFPILSGNCKRNEKSK